MKKLEELAAGQRRIADGTSGLPLEKVNLYRANWGMDDLAELPPGVVVRVPNKKSHAIAHQSPTRKPSTVGPGTELIKIFKGKGVPACQACYSLAAKMDAWGIDGCRSRVEEIVDDMVPRAKDWIKENRGFVARLLAGALENQLIRPKLQGYVLAAIELAEKIAEKTSQLDWAYGVTTVEERRNNLLPRTLESLRLAGFGEPRLFVDGADNSSLYDNLGVPVTTRNPRLKTYGNWILSLWELYVRHPDADRYAVFQDDFVTYRNLRRYLEKCEYPTKGYWNLFTFMENERDIRGKSGWVESRQGGRGAVALVFNREAVTMILSSGTIAEWPQNAARGHSIVDGKVVDACRVAGWKEYIHAPTLVEHTGLVSSMGSPVRAPAKTFRGEDFDALELLSGG